MDILIKLTMKEADRYHIITELLNKKLTEEEARKKMGLKSVRQVRRIKKRVGAEGIQGVAHKGRGRPSNRKFSQKCIDTIMGIVKKKYMDFKPTFAAEKLLENHGIKISSESLRALMTKAGLWKPRSRKKPKKRHVWRERKDNSGELQQFDGSYHKWFEERGEESCLLLSVDDATGEITGAKFDYNEGVVAVFLFWLEYFEENGLPIAIYLDKFSTYKINHASSVDNKELMTQFQRAMNQVGVKLITAHSPQAKGRVERMFETLQDRLVKELRLAGISTIEEANVFLKKKFVPKFNKKFAMVPKKKADIHRAVSKKLKKKLPQMFSIQSERKIQNDYTIMFKNQFFQLEEQQPTTIFKKDRVTVEEHLNGDIKICFKDYYLKYQVLPERPKKQNIPLSALVRQKSSWTPPADHPWRKFTYSKNPPQETMIAA